MDILALGVSLYFKENSRSKNTPLDQLQACCLLSTPAAGDLSKAASNATYPIIQPLSIKIINLHILTVKLIKHKHKNLN